MSPLGHRPPRSPGRAVRRERFDAGHVRPPPSGDRMARSRSSRRTASGDIGSGAASSRGGPAGRPSAMVGDLRHVHRAVPAARWSQPPGRRACRRSAQGADLGARRRERRPGVRVRKAGVHHPARRAPRRRRATPGGRPGAQAHDHGEERDQSDEDTADHYERGEHVLNVSERTGPCHRHRPGRSGRRWLSCLRRLCRLTRSAFQAPSVEDGGACAATAPAGRGPIRG